MPRAVPTLALIALSAVPLALATLRLTIAVCDRYPGVAHAFRKWGLSPYTVSAGRTFPMIGKRGSSTGEFASLVNQGESVIGDSLMTSKAWFLDDRSGKPRLLLIAPAGTDLNRVANILASYGEACDGPSRCALVVLVSDTWLPPVDLVPQSSVPVMTLERSAFADTWPATLGALLSVKQVEQRGTALLFAPGGQLVWLTEGIENPLQAEQIGVLAMVSSGSARKDGGPGPTRQPSVLASRSRKLPIQWLGLTAFEIISGKRIRLRSLLSADRPTAVVFWATWCAPCISEMPILARMAHNYEGRVDFVGIVENPIIGFSSKAARDTVLARLREHGVPYKNYVLDSSVAVEAVAGAATYPYLAIIDRKKRVAFELVGSLESAGHRAAIECALRVLGYDGATGDSAALAECYGVKSSAPEEMAAGS